MLLVYYSLLLFIVKFSVSCSFVCVEDDIHAREGGIVSIGTSHAHFSKFLWLCLFPILPV